MTKYEIINQVSRFVRRLGMTSDITTEKIARAEKESYDFRRISKDHYAVIHGNKMYVIIEHDGQIGCSCEDMSYRRTDGTICKHIIAFSKLLSSPSTPIEQLDLEHLRSVCGWVGLDDELHPPEIQIPPDPDLDIGVSEKPEQMPKSKMYTHPDGTEFKSAEALLDYVDRLKQKQTQKEETKMEPEQKSAWNEDAWNAATQGNFASYSEDGIAEIIFIGNDFSIGKPDKWGRVPYEFDVIQNTKAVVLSVASIRLMHALKAMLPLEGKLIRIVRTGSGMDTKYEVQEVAI